MDADLEGAAFGCGLWRSAALPADDAERVRVRRAEERDSRRLIREGARRSPLWMMPTSTGTALRR